MADCTSDSIKFEEITARPRQATLSSLTALRKKYEKIKIIVRKKYEKNSSKKVRDI